VLFGEPPAIHGAEMNALCHVAHGMCNCPILADPMKTDSQLHALSVSTVMKQAC
jgi:hypothetical protein